MHKTTQNWYVVVSAGLLLFQNKRLILDSYPTILGETRVPVKWIVTFYICICCIYLAETYLISIDSKTHARCLNPWTIFESGSDLALYQCHILQSWNIESNRLITVKFWNNLTDSLGLTRYKSCLFLATRS